MVTAGLMAAVAIPRLALLPFNQNLYGDAISRTEMGERWLSDPHVITSFGDGAGQYGPLHLYLVGIAVAFVDREVAGRLVSLMCGVLTVIPLYRLGRRVAGWQAGAIACLGLAVWGLHVQFSTTAASEAVGLLFIVSAFAAFAAALDSGRMRDFLWAACFMNLAAAVRYDAWMYPPILVSAALWWRRDTAWVGRMASFAALCSVFPLWWLVGNYRLHGDPTFPLAYINAEHREWAATFDGAWRQLWLRAQGIAFWPVMALVTLTPGFALLGMAGMARAWNDRPAVRWLLIAAVAPIVYYGLRTTLFADFVPLTRFMAASLVVLLLFVWDGYGDLTRRWGTSSARTFLRISAALAVAVPVIVGAVTFRRDGPVRNILRPISPTSTNSGPVMAAAAFVRDTVAPSGEAVLIDIDKGFLNLPVVFYGGLTQEEVIRIRGAEDVARIEGRPPTYVVRFDEGTLASQPGVSVGPRALSIGRTAYEELDGFAPPVHVYRIRR
jgi:4-amino-4-deoxy-L-arabinose transferase-like glycosyltransferase